MLVAPAVGAQAAQGSRRRVSILWRKSVSLSRVFELVPVGDTNQINDLRSVGLECAESAPNITSP
jgi:hypothetical protein